MLDSKDTRKARESDERVRMLNPSADPSNGSAYDDIVEGSPADYSNRKSEISDSNNGRATQAYVEKSKYGVFDPDEADEDIQAKVVDHTPMT